MKKCSCSRATRQCRYTPATMRRQYLSRTCPVLLLLFLSCVEPPPGSEGYTRLTTQVDDWRDEVIYQLITDRFADGDVNNNWTVDPSALAKYQGGDWQGIIDRLDYLTTLGVTTIWVSPSVKNVEDDAGVHGYHGYWTQDFLRPNPHFGDIAKFH